MNKPQSDDEKIYDVAEKEGLASGYTHQNLYLMPFLNGVYFGVEYARQNPSEEVLALVEACEMGAFHHAACASNWYSEETKENWDGFGDHRKSKPCTCAHEKVDIALAAITQWEKSK